MGFADPLFGDFKDARSQRLEQAKHGMSTIKKDIIKTDKQIDQLLNRIVETENLTVVTAYEKKIAMLEKQKLISAEKLQNKEKPRHAFDELFELALQFLANPWNIWNSGQLHLRRVVLRLAFSRRISYHRSEGFRTPQATEPFKVFGCFLEKKEMARWGGFEPPTLWFVARYSIQLSYQRVIEIIT